MTDDVLSVRYSPNGRFLAVALLDSTVKVFYQDTLKFFLSLYGHKVGRDYELVALFLTLVLASRALNGHILGLETHSDLFC